MEHSPGFLRLVNEAKRHIQELTVAEARALMTQNPSAILLDVREESEWTAGHAVNAQYLGKGVFERDLEKRFPDPQTPIIMYCGGGFRSALTCEAAQKMGYRRVYSLIGGYRALQAAEWPMKQG